MLTRSIDTVTSPKSSSLVFSRKTSEAVHGTERALELGQPSGTPVQAAPPSAKSDPEVTSQADEEVACGLDGFQREYSFVIRPSGTSNRSSKRTALPAVSSVPPGPPPPGGAGAAGSATGELGREVARAGPVGAFAVTLTRTRRPAASSGIRSLELASAGIGKQRRPEPSQSSQRKLRLLGRVDQAPALARRVAPTVASPVRRGRPTLTGRRRESEWPTRAGDPVAAAGASEMARARARIERAKGVRAMSAVSSAEARPLAAWARARLQLPTRPPRGTRATVQKRSMFPCFSV